jgi:predicted ribosomally synthesized peptide with SipW-like signal peptide
MRNIILAITVVSVLAAAGIGGTLAGYSDLETSEGNYVTTGSLDLKVSFPPGGALHEDPKMPTLVKVENIMPECSDKSTHFDLTNVGEGDQKYGLAYIHVKNVVCEDVEKTEPELAAELAQTPIAEVCDADGTCRMVYAATDNTKPGSATNLPLLGEFGEGCELSEHVRVAIFWSETEGGVQTQVDLSEYDTDPQDGHIKMNEIECQQIFIADLFQGDTIYVEFDVMLQDVEEEDLDPSLNLIPGGKGTKFNDWPTNALQRDKMSFDISCELLQFAPVAP